MAPAPELSTLYGLGVRMTDPPSPYAVLTVVPDGDGYVLGSRYSADFVAVPRIGGDVVRWLQAGATLAECADRAARQMGEPVDVAAFVAGLAGAGLLPAAAPEAGGTHPATAPASAADPVAGWSGRAGRALFGPAGLTVQGGLALAGAVALVTVPSVRPRYTDVIVTGVPLASLLIVAILGTASGLVHEWAHVLAAAARGVPSRVSISRRLVTIVYQTDLTRLWGVPRRDRVVPLLAGMLSDAATVGVLLLLEAASVSNPLTRLLVFLKLAGIVFQFEIFMRTDVYALFVVATGCRNLWATKGAVARRAIGRATADDQTLLAAVGRREIRWARVYLLLYVPGVAWTCWYFAGFAVPAIRRLLAMSIAAIMESGPVSPVGAAGLVALVATVASTGYVLWGAARTVVRLAGQLRRSGRR